MSQLGTSYDNENVHQRERGHDIQVTEMHSSQTDFDDEYTHTTELRDGNKLRNPHAPFAESVVGKALLVTFIVVAIITLVFTAVRMNSRLQQLHTASTLNFVVIGDWGAYNDPQRLVAARMGEACERAIPPCAFVISVGDNFYPDGVTSTTDTKFKDVFEEVYTHSSLQKRWYMALGNHDYRGNPQAQVDYTLLSDRWYLPSRYYAHDQFVGIKGSPHSFNVKFAFMDTNPFVEKYRHDTVYNPAEIIKQNITEQMEWLEDILSGEYQGSGESDISDDPQESTHRTWKIMIGHHPVYSAASHGDTEEMKNMVKPMLEKYHVHAMFAGHDHNLQHIEELPNSVPFEVEYFVSGSGSKQRDDKHAMPYRLRNFTSDYGFLFVSIEEDKMTVNFINSEGKTVYTSVTDYRP